MIRIPLWVSFCLVVPMHSVTQVGTPGSSAHARQWYPACGEPPQASLLRWRALGTNVLHTAPILATTLGGRVCPLPHRVATHYPPGAPPSLHGIQGRGLVQHRLATEHAQGLSS